MKSLTTTLLALLLVPTLASAQCFDLLLDTGTLSFDYELAGGGSPGTFLAVGGLSSAPPEEGSAAVTFELDGVNYFVVLGAVPDSPGFSDSGIIIVSSVAPIVAGSYPLDGVTGLFVFVDDAIGWTPPVDLCATNWTLELASIVASGKYGSTGGTVNITSLSPTGASGTFSAAIEDPDTGALGDVTAGSFNVLPPSSTEESTWGSVKTLYR